MADKSAWVVLVEKLFRVEMIYNDGTEFRWRKVRKESAMAEPKAADGVKIGMAAVGNETFNLGPQTIVHYSPKPSAEQAAPEGDADSYQRLPDDPMGTEQAPVDGGRGIAQEAITRLEEIFTELQEPNSVTHDAWDWMDAHFQLEVLKSVLVPIPVSPDPRVEEIRNTANSEEGWSRQVYTEKAKRDIRYLLSKLDRLKEGR